MAFLRGRGYVVPEDVKEIAKDVLRHRILLTYEAEAENVTTDTVVDRDPGAGRGPVSRPTCSTGRPSGRSGGSRSARRSSSSPGSAAPTTPSSRGAAWSSRRCASTQPGDDVRTIDWNVTARMGAPYVKKFVEERDLTLLLLVDVSGSQALRLALPPEARLRGGARRGARLLRGGQPRPRGRGALLGPHRGLRAARAAAATTRCGSCATCWPCEPAGRGTDLAGALRFAQRRAAAPRHRGRRSPTSRPRATSARSASCAAATT